MSIAQVLDELRCSVVDEATHWAAPSPWITFPRRCPRRISPFPCSSNGLGLKSAWKFRKNNYPYINFHPLYFFVFIYLLILYLSLYPFFPFFSLFLFQLMDLPSLQRQSLSQAPLVGELRAFRETLLTRLDRNAADSKFGSDKM